MSEEQPKNPLHGVTLKSILEELVENRGWEDLAARIHVRCFENDPSIPSSLKFLRKTDWARAKVERMYLDDQRERERNQKRNKRRACQRAYRAEQDSADSSDTSDGAELDGSELGGSELDGVEPGEFPADSDESDGGA